MYSHVTNCRNQHRALLRVENYLACGISVVALHTNTPVFDNVSSISTNYQPRTQSADMTQSSYSWEWESPKALFCHQLTLYNVTYYLAYPPTGKTFFYGLGSNHVQV